MHTYMCMYVCFAYFTYFCRLELRSELSAPRCSQSVTNWPPPKLFDSCVVYLLTVFFLT